MTEHDEKWLLSRGWTKIKGFKIDGDLMDDIFDGRNARALTVDGRYEVYVPSIEDIDAIKKCEYYVKEKFVTENIDEAINYEEHTLDE